MLPAGSAKTSGAPQYFSIPKTSSSTNFQPGVIQYTGNKTDVAIEGSGFFEIQLPNGKPALTRDGEFQINSQGYLVTKEGYNVMGDAGAIKLDPRDTNQVSISNDGTVSQGSTKKAKLKIDNFANPQLLTQLSGSYFVAEGKGIQPVDAKATLRQGYLEGSNTSTVREMANMLTAMRTFEANEKIVQMQDDRLGKAIAELGNPN